MALAIVAKNRASNADSDGFMLGASIAEWIFLDQIADTRPLANFNSAQDIAQAHKNAADAMEGARAIKKKLGITSDEIVKAAGIADISAGPATKLALDAQ